MAISDELIRERAYQLWLAAGSPIGQEKQHWDHARIELEYERTAAEQDSAADEASAGSFPASDPPARTGMTGPGGSKTGRPV